MGNFNPFAVDGLRYLKLKGDDQHEYYSIGDVHGCGHEYQKLVDLIEDDAESRGKIAKIIQHGDLIDRGPEFLGVLSIAFDHICILGNHEHNFVLERLGKPCSSNSRKVSHERFERLQPLTQKNVMSFLNNLYNFVVVEIGERTFFLSHAPVKDLEKFYGWSDYMYRGNAPYFCMRSSVPIDDDIKKLHMPYTFVYGHQSWEYKDIEEQKNEQDGRTTQYYNIDGSCVYGGKLIALRLSDLGVLSVDSNVCAPK